jgi:hypothetical protein
MTSNQATSAPTPTTSQAVMTTADPPVSSAASAFAPDNTLLTVKYISEMNSGWPTDLKLDLDFSNWDEWSFQVLLLAGRCDFTRFLDGMLLQPPIDMHAKAHSIWKINDNSLEFFLFGKIARSDYRTVSTLTTSHDVFEELRKMHEKQGLHAQVILIKKALEIHSQSDQPLLKTAEEIDTLHA